MIAPSANERALTRFAYKHMPVWDRDGELYECSCRAVVTTDEEWAAHLAVEGAKAGVLAVSAISGEYPLSGSEREAGRVTAADLRYWMRRVARDLE